MEIRERAMGTATVLGVTEELLIITKLSTVFEIRPSEHEALVGFI